MTFEHYYATSDSDFIFYIFFGIVAMAIVVGIAMVVKREFSRKVLVRGLVAGVVLGFAGATIYSLSTAQDTNASIVQKNIEKKYDVQSVAFDFTTIKAGGHGWIPTQSDSQQVTVKVGGVSHVAMLTQNSQTTEPTLIDVDTHKEIAHKDSSQ